MRNDITIPIYEEKFASLGFIKLKLIRMNIDHEYYSRLSKQ
jgi:hypothetical protein